MLLQKSVDIVERYKKLGYGHHDNCDIEFCNNCESETEVEVVFKAQKCTHCGAVVLPCNKCDMDRVNCADCPLGG